MAFSAAEPRGRFGFGLGSLSGVERALKGRYTIVLRRVVYLKRFARESKVGFGL